MNRVEYKVGDIVLLKHNHVGLRSGFLIGRIDSFKEGSGIGGWVNFDVLHWPKDDDSFFNYTNKKCWGTHREFILRKAKKNERLSPAMLKEANQIIRERDNERIREMTTL